MSHNTSLSAYRQALTTPAARIPVLASLLARLPIAMVGFSVLLYVQHVTGSFAVAGLAGAGILLGISLGSVGQGRIIDRLGPTRPILVICALFTVAISVLVVAIGAGAPTPVLVIAAVAAGATQPMVASASRSLWNKLLPGGPAREAAYAYEAISMEVFFIIGPGLSGLLITAPWAGTGVVVGAACMLAGSVAFALSPAVRAWRPRRGSGGSPLLGALSSPGMRTLAIAALGFGTVIGFVEVAVPAVATAAGHRPLGGLLLSVWSFSSVAFGLYYSTRPWPRAMHLRLPVLLAGFGTMVGLLALPTALAPASMLLLACSMVVAGALITPQATAHSSVIERVTPAGTATEAFGWVITAVTLGLAAGQSLSGYLTEHAGPPVAFLAAAASATALAIVVYARRSTVSSSSGTQVIELSPDADLGGTPQGRVDVGVDELDDLADTCVRT